MRRVAVGKTTEGYDQAVGTRHRKEWYRHKMSRKQLVGITGQKVQVGARGSRDRRCWWRDKGQRVEDEVQRTMAGNGTGCNQEGLDKGDGER